MPKKQTILRVRMHCEGCSARISQALKNRSGVCSVSPDLNSGMVHVEYDPEKISVEAIKTAISDLGYYVE